MCVVEEGVGAVRGRHRESKVVVGVVLLEVSPEDLRRMLMLLGGMEREYELRMLAGCDVCFVDLGVPVNNASVQREQRVVHA